MNKQDLQNSKNVFAELLKHLPREDVLAFFKLMAEVRRDLAETERDIRRIDARRDVLLAQIQSRHLLLEQAMGHIFAERRAVIEKHFSVIDHGIQKGDRDIINTGLGGLADLVCSNPFQDLAALSSSLNSGETIEI